MIWFLYLFSIDTMTGYSQNFNHAGTYASQTVCEAKGKIHDDTIPINTLRHIKNHHICVSRTPNPNKADSKKPNFNYSWQPK